MDNTNITINGGSKMNNILDKTYIKQVKDSLRDINIFNRWSTYESIISDLINYYGENSFKEIKYRFTDGEELNDIFIDMINRTCESSKLLSHHIRRLNEFIIEDLTKRFY